MSDFLNDIQGGLTNVLGSPGLPVEAFDVVGQHDPRHRQASAQGDFKRVTLDLASDWAKQR